MGAPDSNGKDDRTTAKRPPSSLGATMSTMAGAIGTLVAWQQSEWDHRRREQQQQKDGQAQSGAWLDISPEAAVPIPDVQRPRRIAYVDGGNATLLGSPGWSVGLNRVAYAVCQGETVHQPRYMPRVDFLSLLAAEPGDMNGTGEGTVRQARRYALRTFPIAGGGADGGHPPRLDSCCVPTDADMGNIDGNGTGTEGGDGDAPDNPPDTSRPATEHNRSRMMSVPRAFAEWKMASAVVRRELGEGDVIVLDGTLQTGYGGEARLAAELYEQARRRGVTVCALAKTTTMMGPGGVPILYAAQEAARTAGHHTWYMPLARRASGGNSGFMLAVRLHRHSRFTYRLEVLRDQYDRMVENGWLEKVIGSIAASSGDPSFPGYPYGLVSADRHARVRGAEAEVHRRMLLGEMGRHELGRTMVDHTLLLSAHKALDRAVGG